MLIFFAFAIPMLSMLLFIPSLEPTAVRWYSQAILSSASFAQGNFTVESLFIALTSDGDAIIEYDVRLPKTQLQRTNITLIGNTINDLGVSDYQHNPLLYRLNEKTREASINSSGATHLLITYSSSDLVDKRDRVWTFSVDSPVIFSLKMPLNHKLLNWEEIIPPRPSVGYCNKIF